MQLCEKWRPRTLADVVGHRGALSSIRRVLGRSGWDRDAFWLSGATGTGKTTIAQALATEVGCPPGSFGYEEMDGDRCGVNEVRCLQDQAARGSLFESWRVVIVNEAHAMTPKAIQAWLTFIERLPARWLIVFTTTEQAEDLFGNFHGPFMGRVKPIALKKPGLVEAFAARLRQIARAEGMNGKPLSYYRRAVRANRCDLRTCIQSLEMGVLPDVERLSPLQQKAVRGLVARTKKKARS
jgi:replication-associated recombination protein RarA